jgi:hypothetical protein
VGSGHFSLLLEGDWGDDVEADERGQGEGDGYGDEVDVDAACCFAVVEGCHVAPWFRRFECVGAKRKPTFAASADTWVPEIL